MAINQNLVLLVKKVTITNQQQPKWSRQLFSQSWMSIRFLLEHKAAEQSAALLRCKVIKHTIEQELGYQ